VLEGSHCLTIFYDGNEAGMPMKIGCKTVVHFPIEEMDQEPCEGLCEHSC
jgi:hypothetical protein